MDGDLLPGERPGQASDRPSDGHLNAARSGSPEFRPYFDASPFATLLFTPDLVLIDSNAAHVRASGVPSQVLRGRAMFDVWPKNPNHAGPDTEDVLRTSIARVLETKASDEPPVQRHDLPSGNGAFEARFWRMIHSPVIENGEVVAIRQDSWDVTDAIMMTERQQAMQRIAGSIAGIAFWELDVDADTIVRTPELDAIFGFPRLELVSGPGGPASPATELDPFRRCVHPDDAPRFDAVIAEMVAAGAGSVRQIEYRLIRPSGDVRRVAVRGEMNVGLEGQPVIVGTTLDVTDLHANEARLEGLLSEKEMLLGEVNHRVKNSLQLVSSILSLEARQADERERARLMSAAARVHAVSAVHASLDHNDDVRTVEFGAHLRQFCGRLADSLGAEARGIAVLIETEAVTLQAETAVPLSLIVNELVTNAFKYAFADQAPAGSRVSVSFSRSSGSDGELILVVTDNGTEPSAREPDPDRSALAVPLSSGLGARLVSTLASQIGASVSTERAGGWTTRIVFMA